MENQKVNAEILNDLIEINNDRIKGYQKAIEELQLEDQDLKTGFAEMIVQSNKNKSELVQEVQVLGIEPETGTTASGKIYRTWMDVKAVFTGHDRQTILNNCEYGEDAAQRAYQMALESDELAAHLRSLIDAQKTDLKVSHDHIRSLRNQLA